MEIQFKDMVVEVPDADQDGPHYFRLNGLFWEVWNRDKSLCKLHGFDVERDGSGWIGVYRPFALFGEGTKRLARYKEGNI